MKKITFNDKFLLTQAVVYNFKLIDWYIMKNIICKIFGHNVVEKVYATKSMTPHRFHVCKEVRCLRCGETLFFQASEPKRRSELLQEGWFVEIES